VVGEAEESSSRERERERAFLLYTHSSLL